MNLHTQIPLFQSVLITPSAISKKFFTKTKQKGLDKWFKYDFQSDSKNKFSRIQYTDNIIYKIELVIHNKNNVKHTFIVTILLLCGLEQMMWHKMRQKIVLRPYQTFFHSCHTKVLIMRISHRHDLARFSCINSEVKRQTEKIKKLNKCLLSLWMCPWIQIILPKMECIWTTLEKVKFQK